MVGVPRSSGCQLCRKRKVKCDETHPACGNCVKYGAECPGYDRSLKFVAGKHQIRQRGKRFEGSSRSSSTDSDSSQSFGTSLSYRSRSIVVTPFSRQSPVSAPPVDRALEPIRGHVLYTMIEKFCPSAPPDLFGLFNWLQFEQLGQRALLDGAICSLALHLAGKEKSNSQLVAQSRTVYGKSIGQLQAALRHPSEWRSSETLFAAILLCYFELFAGTSSPDTWLQHAHGIGVLMEQRGPAAHAEGWDAAMLLSFRGILIMSDMFFPREDNCFLSRQEWKPTMRDDGRRLVHPPDTPREHIIVIDGFFERLADVPAVLKWGYLVREARNAGISVDPSQLVILSHLAAANHASFSKWYDEEFTSLPQVQPTEALPANPETSLYPTVLEYVNQWAGSMHLGVWASMLILQETLVQCGTPLPGSDAAKQDLVSKILRSVESVSRGTMGPYRVGYSLRVVYEFASAEAQVWIGTLLDTFTKSYASIDRKTYPPVRED
ncbi:C6 zinc finger domain protein [Dactylonectria estremocensis]|uniref:C6 zinc finger domain protein n=1 Tax=Dactylonectria estremocensis TaxID=1079267 RepID=A0A9P9FK39_9HYPO|nr:C6 zinc finger domain protein [Dactylonectria estremocensis]